MNQHLINYLDLILKNMKPNNEQYYEKHHVFPVGIFGDNNFLVELSYIDHVKAHYYLYQYLLEKRGHDHRHTISAGRALYLMCNRSASLKSIDVNFIESLVPKVSVPHLPETKEKIKLALSGRKRLDFNYKHSDEAKEKIRKSKIPRIKKFSYAQAFSWSYKKI